ncbi:MAG: YjbQ family protein [Crenarchaeota archaeon]|nr:YjbQ family protein [Thermoproteota archaeon]
MKVFIKEFTVATRTRFEVVDITGLVEDAVSSSGVSDGIVVVHVPHATAAIMLNEAEPNLFHDYVDMVKELFKPDAQWRHNMIDNNAHAHLAAAVIGSSRVIPLRGGRMMRGTWQNILLLELDGPRHRRVIVEVMGV